MTAIALPRRRYSAWRDKLRSIQLGLGARGALGLGLGLGRGNVGGFVGAYDAIPSVIAAFGMRRLLSYSGSLIRLRRASDNAESDFGYTDDGDLDTAAIATWLTATTGYVVTWYDQSGNGKDIAQSTTTKQPLYVANGQNSKPVLQFDGTDDTLAGPSVDLTAGWTVISVARNAARKNYNGLVRVAASETTVSPTLMEIYWQQGSSNSGNFTTVINRSGVDYNYALTTNAPPPVGDYYVATVRNAITYGERYINGNLLTISSSGGSASSIPASAALLWVGLGYYGGAPYLNGNVAELVICSAALSSGDRSAAEAAANAYWSIY